MVAAICALLVLQEKPAGLERCEKNLLELAKQVEAYQKRFGGSRKLVPVEKGPDFWLELTRTDPPLVARDALSCPLSGRPYRGPSSYLGVQPMGQFIAACEPGSHPDGSIHTLRFPASVQVVKPVNPFVLREALRLTRGDKESIPDKIWTAYSRGSFLSQSSRVEEAMAAYKAAARLIRENPGMSGVDPAIVDRELATLEKWVADVAAIEKEWPAFKAKASTAAPDQAESLSREGYDLANRARRFNRPWAEEASTLARSLVDKAAEARRTAPRPDQDAGRAAARKRGAEALLRALKTTIERKETGNRDALLKALKGSGFGEEVLREEIARTSDPAMKAELEAALAQMKP